MRRRTVVKTGLLAAAHALLWRTRGARAARRQERVLVLGAGMAGLAAARQLQADGYRVTVVEGRDRLGGRTWTSQLDGTAVDLGASWIEGTRGNPLTALARELRVETVATGDGVAVFDHDGAPVSDDDLEAIDGEFDDLLDELDTLAGSLATDISIGDGVRRVLADETLSAEEQRALAWALASMSTDSAADADEMSLVYADDDDGFGGDSVIFPGGYGQLADGLARGIDVRLEHRVHRIEHGGPAVRVHTSQGILEGDRAVVTLPLGVLREGGIVFAPELPGHTREAIDALRMGILQKVVLKFDRAFWPAIANFGYISETPGQWPEFFNQHLYTGVPVLIGFAPGTYGRETESRSEAAVRREVMGIVRAMFGSSAPDPVAMTRTRWGADPFSYGSYSYIPVGGRADHRDRLAEPVGERLFFAGEATTRDYPATVHGAYLTGVRAARRIADV